METVIMVRVIRANHPAIHRRMRDEYFDSEEQAMEYIEKLDDKTVTKITVWKKIKTIFPKEIHIGT